MDKYLIEKAKEAKKNRQKAMLATVIAAQGSAPRDKGAKMLILEEGKIFGTIGGGELEAEIIAQAVSLMKEAETGASKYNFDLSNEEVAVKGGVCGGQVEVFLEPIIWGEGSD